MRFFYTAPFCGLVCAVAVPELKGEPDLAFVERAHALGAWRPFHHHQPKPTSASSLTVSEISSTVASLPYSAVSDSPLTSISISTASYSATTSVAATSADVSSVATSVLSSTVVTGKPVFFHYLIGEITSAHIEQDVIDAQALGADAFAVNTNTVDFVTYPWALQCINDLFYYAEVHDFKIFFSFDMTGFTDPSHFVSFLDGYLNNSTYFKYASLPLVSTFNGGLISNDEWYYGLVSAVSTPIYFLPSFQDIPASSTFFSTFPSANGTFNWNAWPQITQGPVSVLSSDDDSTLQLAATNTPGKTFMMAISPLQYKNLGTADLNWYRRGEENLELRLGQVLAMQPDLLEFITWNDAGESHYMGNSWPEPIVGSPQAVYSTGYDHTGYWQILRSFIQSWKAGATTTDTMYPTNGAAVQGVFWHHTMLANASCDDPPAGSDLPEDRITAVVLLAANATTHFLDIYSGYNMLGAFQLTPGFNEVAVDGMGLGAVSVVVRDGGNDAVVVNGTGPIDVTDAGVCNYNFQVVALT